jgi:hypothetical protein
MAVTISMRIDSIVLESALVVERTAFERALREELAAQLNVRLKPDSPSVRLTPDSTDAALARHVAREIGEAVEDRIDWSAEGRE